ncbi:hypothetical protein EX30DRAFT_341055 [Ascodesmis nigricans]|uniref:25S rRNA (uridine-N(3))-methyltransferase BMT5-like domain-containing protein n=1 Tax=Ascodesmis nigricans TaxID=341454 RepID=A0A4S2MWX6_9PEZI|nr:hypothetical protein EX30DRAFT_341055 [Ascodesmis nigricans]
MSKKRKHNFANSGSSRTNKKQKPGPPPSRSQKSSSAFTAAVAKSSSKSRQAHQQKLPPLNPFPPNTDVLLVGEGDLSFSHLLATAPRGLRVKTLIATTFDSRDELERKYPSTAPGYIADLSSLSPSSSSCSSSSLSSSPTTTVTLLHSIDATRLSSSKAIKSRKYDVIGFLFPHIGGKTKDQDRQIRGNQILLKGFFAAAKPLLKEGGRVVVSLFEGAVYDMWDIRGLARGDGMVGVTAGRFGTEVWEGKKKPEEKEGVSGKEGEESKDKKDEESVEDKGDPTSKDGGSDDGKKIGRGYRHARTLGELEGRGAWRGEERNARWFIFCKKGYKDEKAANAAMSVGQKKKKKSKSGDESSSEDEGSDGGWDNADIDNPWFDEDNDPN